MEVPVNPSAGLPVTNNNVALHYTDSNNNNASHGSYYNTGVDLVQGFILTAWIGKRIT